MLKEELIKYETAKLAHEKSFDGMCIHQYCMDKEGEPYLYETPYYLAGIGDGYNGFIIREDLEEGDVLAPSQSLLQRWLREVHNLHINVNDGFIKGFYVSVGKLHKNEYLYDADIMFKTYEEALEVGLLKALELIK